MCKKIDVVHLKGKLNHIKRWTAMLKDDNGLWNVTRCRIEIDRHINEILKYYLPSDENTLKENEEKEKTKT